MSMAYTNARNQYLKTQVETASKEQLVVMLFDGILRFTELARKALQENAIEAGHTALMRAEAIVMELIVTVDKNKGGDIATNLLGLHAYAYNALVQCNLHKDESKIDEVQNIYRKLREGWVSAMASLGITGPMQAAASPARGATPPAGAPAASPIATPAQQTAPAPHGTMPDQGSKGIMAGSKSVAVAAAKPASAAGTYGMGRTAMLGAYARPAAAVVSAPGVQTPERPQKAAMLGAYQAGARNIA